MFYHATLALRCKKHSIKLVIVGQIQENVKISLIFIGCIKIALVGTWQTSKKKKLNDFKSSNKTPNVEIL